MILDRPFQTVTPTVDGDVLGVLGRADAWFSITELNSVLGESRSARGLRLALQRLTDQGIVEARAVGRSRIYRLNDQHLVAGPVREIARAVPILMDRIRRRLEEWPYRPAFFAVYGSGARGGMRADSDIDLFIAADEPERLWDGGLPALITDIAAWTGNDPRPIVYVLDDLVGQAREEPILESVARDGVWLVGTGQDFRKLIRG